MSTNRALTKPLPRQLPKLERLVLDTDVNAHLRGYLEAVGFDVLFALHVDVDIHDDTAIVIWARRHRRLFVTHDKFSDRQTRIKLHLEVYENGGQAIRIGGGPEQHPLTSLGKILVHRHKWVEFFKENDGIALVHETGLKLMPREYLYHQIQSRMIDSSIALRSQRRRKRAPRAPREPPSEQGRLALP